MTALVVLVAMTVAACNSGDDGPTADVDDGRSRATSVAPPESPVIALNYETNAWPAAQIRGSLTQHDGCLFIGPDVAVFPYGTTWQNPEVVFSDGTRVAVGSHVRMGGGQFDLSVSQDGLPIVPMTTVKACARRSNAKHYVWAMP